VGAKLGVRSRWPAVRQLEAPSVPARPACAAAFGFDGVGVEDPVRADAHQDLGPGVGQPVGEGDGVIAGVEDEHGDLAVGGQQTHQPAYLVDGGRLLTYDDPLG
jgi:hypothetical protein